MQEKVLVIEDYLPSAQALQWAMEAIGHEVQVASDGKGAIAQSETFVPDIVLCDIKLPDMSGYEICKQMRANPKFHNTLFLAQTGLADRASKQRSSKAGFHYHLVKPIDINKLFELVYLDRANRERLHNKKAHRLLQDADV